MHRIVVCFATLISLAFAQGAYAQSADVPPAPEPLRVTPVASFDPEPIALADENIFVFGGKLQSGYFIDSFNPFTAPYESNTIIGGGYQRFLWRSPGIVSVGVETGLAARIGSPSSLEAWVGAVARFDGLPIGENWRLVPSVTFGLSAVTDTIGAERRRAITNGENGRLLFYLSPEIALSTGKGEGPEYFLRLQHRSGAFGTLAHLDGANAPVVGVRFKF